MNSDYLQDPFIVYQTYVLIKSHFTSAYDYVKFRGKNNTITEQTFKKRKDRPLFHQLATILNESEDASFFISKFIENEQQWVGDITFHKIESMKIYRAWKTRMELMIDNYKIDLMNIGNKGYTWQDILSVRNETHPLLFKLVNQKKITPETYIIIDSFTNFIDKTIELMKNDNLYRSLNFKYQKYRSFIQADPKKILKITPKQLTKL